MRWHADSTLERARATLMVVYHPAEHCGTLADLHLLPPHVGARAWRLAGLAWCLYTLLALAEHATRLQTLTEDIAGETAAERRTALRHEQQLWCVPTRPTVRCARG